MCIIGMWDSHCGNQNFEIQICTNHSVKIYREHVGPDTSDHND